MKFSKRQQQILQALEQGHTNAEIAASFGVTEHTIKTHVSRLFQKMQVNNRLAAVAKYRVEKLKSEVSNEQAALRLLTDAVQIAVNALHAEPKLQRAHVDILELQCKAHRILLNTTTPNWRTTP